MTTNYYGRFDGDALVAVHEDPTPEDVALQGLYRLPDWPGRWPAPAAPHLRLVRRAGRLVWGDRRTLQEARSERWEAIKAERKRRAEAPVVTPEGTFDADERAFSALARQVAAGGPARWTLADNTRRLLSAAQLKAALVAISDQVQAAFDTADTLREQLQSAKTNEAVDSVRWP